MYLLHNVQNLLILLKLDLDECPNEGVFSIPNTGCKSYKICSQLGATNFSCPSTTLFDQRAQKCVLDFICPDTTICAYAPAGLYPDPNYSSNNKFYIECYGIENFMVRYGECDEGKFFQSETGMCENQNGTTTISISSESSGSTTETINSTETTSFPIITTLAPSTSTSNCFQEGAIFPLFDTNCKEYGICKKSDDGISLVTESYLCPVMTFFDPWKSNCLSDYKCLENYCLTQPENIYYLDPNDSDKKRYYACVWNEKGVLQVYYSCGDNEVFDFSGTRCVEANTKCTEEGISSVLQADCNEFQICSKSGTSLVLRTYKCPIMTLFDQWKNQCMSFSDYVCVESNCYKQPEGIFYLDPNDPDKKRYYECVRGDEGVLPKYYWCGDDEIFDEVEKRCIKNVETTSLTSLKPSTPNCTIDGSIFPVYWKITGCKEYGICRKSGTSLVLEIYQCPTLTFFDTFESECVSDYQCLENYCYNQPENIYYLDPNDPIKKRYYSCVWDETGNLQLYYSCGDNEVFNGDTVCVETDTKCTKEGIFPTNRCQVFQICSKSATSFVFRTYKCALLTYFDPWKSQCFSDYKCLQDYCYDQPKNIFYLDPNDSEKKRFYQCITYKTILFERNIPLYYSCGDDEVFDEVQKRCVKNFETTNTTLAPSISNCSIDGSILPVNYTNCLEYKICFKFELKTYRCPGITIFDPFKGGCVFDYTCIENYCLHQFENIFYLDPNDLDKRRFYECIWDEKGVLPKYYWCEIGEVFDDVIKKCVGYVITTETTDLSTTSSSNTSSSITFAPTTFPSTTSSPITSLSTSSSPITPSTLIPPTSDCYQAGLFPVLNSDCKIYKSCREVGTSFVEENYRCPTRTFFDPWKTECVSGYKCLENACLYQQEGSTLFLDPNDSDKKRYYQCVWDGLKISPVYYSCKDGNIFDDTKQMCVENVGFMRWMWMGFKKLVGI